MRRSPQRKAPTPRPQARRGPHDQQVDPFPGEWDDANDYNDDEEVLIDPRD